MSRYLKPVTVPALPQGDWKFTPIVKVFGEHDSPQDLQDEMNQFLLLTTQEVESSISIGQIDYQATQKSNNNVVHSALMHYTLISVN